MLLSLLFHVDADFFELHVNLSESHFNGLANDWWHLTRENWSIRVLRGSCRKFGDRSLECKTKNSTSTFLCLTRNRGQSPRGGGFFVSPPQRGKRQETRGQSPSFSKGTKRGQRGHRRPIHQRSDEGNGKKPGDSPHAIAKRSSTNGSEPHFTGRRGVARLIKAQTQRPGGLG